MTLVAQGCVDRPVEPTPSAAPTDTAGPGTLRWALSQDPTSLDPRRIVTAEDGVIVDALFDALTRLGPELDAEPALATAWTVSPDARTHTFTLDPDATWHDGTPVVAQDVVRGLRRVVDGSLEPVSLHHTLLQDVDGYAAARGGGALRGVAAPDASTVVVTTVRPTPELPQLLAHPALAPVPAAAEDDPEAFGVAPLGNGPFQLAEPWAHNQFVRLQPSLNHPDRAAAPDVVFRVYAEDRDRSVQYGDLLGGQLQVARVPLGLRGDAREEFGVATGSAGPGVHEGLLATTSLLVFDTRRPPFDDARARRAVSLLVDRSSLADRTDRSRAPASGLVPPSLPGSQDVSCAWCRYDPAGAAALFAAVLADLEQAGEEVPTLVLQTSSDPVHSTLADQLSGSLRASGFAVRVVRADPTAYLTTIEETEASVVRLGWTAHEPTLRSWVDDLFGDGTLPAGLTGWRPEPMVDLLARIADATDAGVRQRLRQRAVRLALDEAAVAPVLFYRDDLVVGDDVRGLRVDALGNVDLARVVLVGGDG